MLFSEIITISSTDWTIISLWKVLFSMKKSFDGRLKRSTFIIRYVKTYNGRVSFTIVFKMKQQLTNFSCIFSTKKNSMLLFLICCLYEWIKHSNILYSFRSRLSHCIWLKISEIVHNETSIICSKNNSPFVCRNIVEV